MRGFKHFNQYLHWIFPTKTTLIWLYKIGILKQDYKTLSNIFYMKHIASENRIEKCIEETLYKRTNKI